MDDLEEFKSAVAHGDWALAKKVGLRLRAQQSTRPADTPEAAALAALCLPGSALDQLAASADTFRAKWIAEQIIKLGRTKPVDKRVLARLALDLRRVLTRTGAPIDEDLAVQALKQLRNARAFEALVTLGDRMVALGAAEPEIRKLVVQGMIDTGQPTAGLAALEAMLTATAPTHRQHIDGLGLAGRIHKQVYVDAAGANGAIGRPVQVRKALIESARRYEDAYLAARNNPLADVSEWSYPAINLVAVLLRAERDNINVNSRINPRTLAQEIIAAFGPHGEQVKAAWDLASIGEAHYALKKFGEANEWLTHYASRDDTNAFELAGTVRQLEEVWSLDATDKQAGHILLFLKAQLLAKEGSHVELTAQERADLLSAHAQSADGAFPEVFLSDGRPKPLSWFKTGLERANSVGLIKRKSDGQGFGTGFLVRGGDFIPGLGDTPILITNAHVISSYPEELHDPRQPSERVERAEVEFTNVDGRIDQRTYQFERILFQSRRSEFDTCLLLLVDPPTHIQHCILSTKTPDVSKTRVIVIGHPGGERETKVSLYEGGVTFFGPKGLLAPERKDGLQFLRYNNPTIGGNSGSPVFDIEDWCVIGLHHAGAAAPQGTGAGLPDAVAQPFGNEGVFIRSIVAEASKCQQAQAAVAEGVAAQTSPAATFQAAPQARAVTTLFKPVFPLEATAGRPFDVDLTVARGAIEGLINAQRPADSAHHTAVPLASTAIDLKSPDGSFLVHSADDHRQWLDRKGGGLDDSASWRWTVTPLKPGQTKLVLQFTAREFRSGATIAIGPIEQELAVRIKSNWRRQAWTVSALALASVAGAGAMFVAFVVSR